MPKIYEDDIAPIKQEFPGIIELDAKILFLRRDSFSYTMIQRWLGNPSKKYIRSVLLKYDADLINIDSE